MHFLIQQLHAEINFRIQSPEHFHHRIKTRIGQVVFQLGNLGFLHAHHLSELLLGQVALQARFFDGSTEQVEA